MAFTNPFRSLKDNKYLQTAGNIAGSVAKSAFQSAGKAVSGTANKVISKSPVLRGGIDAYNTANNILKPKTSTQPAQNQSQNPQMSVATSQQSQQQVPSPSLPRPQQTNMGQPQQQRAEVPGTMNDFFTRQQQAREEQLRKSQELADRQFGLNKQALEGQIPQLDQQLAEFSNATNQQTEALRAKTERSKDTVRDEFGDAQRLAAQTQRETRGDAARRFASLNTSDSFGEGSYTQANENIDSEFNRFTQQNLKQQANRLADLEEGMAAAEREATSALRQKSFEMNTLKGQIQQALAQNDINKASQLNSLYEAAQSDIFEIQGAMENLKFQYDQEANKQNALLSQVAQLSDSFKTTGKPETELDFIFSLQNPEWQKNQIAMAGSGASKPLSGEAAKIVGFTQSGLSSAQTMRSILQQNPNAAFLPGIFNRDFKYAQDNMTDAIGRLRSGGAIGEEEATNLSRLIPSAMDSAELKANKLADFEREMSTVYQRVTNEQAPMTMNQMFGQGQQLPGLDSFIGA
jgi:hypothetical protein